MRAFPEAVAYRSFMFILRHRSPGQMALAVRKNVFFFPAREIEPCPCGQKAETLLCQPLAALPLQPSVKHVSEPVQIQNIACGILELCLAQGVSRPVRALLLLGQIHVEQFLAQVLQSVPVGIGPRQPGGDLGTIDRVGFRSEGIEQHGDVETAEMEYLALRAVAQQFLQVGRSFLALFDLNHIGGAVARRQLHDAQPVAGRFQAERFRVDGDIPFIAVEAGKVVLVNPYGQGWLRIGTIRVLRLTYRYHGLQIVYRKPLCRNRAETGPAAATAYLGRESPLLHPVAQPRSNDLEARNLELPDLRPDGTKPTIHDCNFADGRIVVVRLRTIRWIAWDAMENLGCETCVFGVAPLAL